VTDPLLSVEGLRTQFHTDRGTVHAVDGVSFTVERGETVRFVGEFGSDETVTGGSLTRPIPSPPGEVAGGRTRFDGRDLTSLPAAELRSIPGDRTAHVFQNPQDALDHVYTVGWQVREAIEIHRDPPEEAVRERAVDLLDRVGIPEAADRVDDYPREFSGGMKRRVVVAVALAADPDLLVADGPTTALDVTIQMGILRLLRQIQGELDTAILLITHGLGIVAEVADRAVVTYVGKVTERADVYDLLGDPAHPTPGRCSTASPAAATVHRPSAGRSPPRRSPPSLAAAVRLLTLCDLRAYVMPSALFVVSEEGYWGEECVEPLTTLDEAGFDITVATPSGGDPVIDDTSIDPDEVGEETAERVKEVHENDEHLNDPVSVAAESAGDYDAVVFPGGHGTEWDVNQDYHTRQLLADAVSGDEGKALVVCHAVGILGFTWGEAEGQVVEGRDVTGFPNEWEDEIVDENEVMPNGRKLPYRVEDEVIAAGGNWDAELDADESVTVDGDLITARGPESSSAAASTLLDELGVERPA